MRHVTERMEEAEGQLALRYPKRSVKAFYLGPDDWADFIATNPPMIDTIWNCAPAYEYSFMGSPVRQSKNVGPRTSRLYDSSGTGRPLGQPIKPDGRSVQTERQKAALAEARANRLGVRQRTPRDMIVSLGDDEGWLNWQSSPHVMFLMWALMGCPGMQEGGAEAPPPINAAKV
jgi:hypothetical protein